MTWVLNGIICAHCGTLIHVEQTLDQKIKRSRLERIARQNGGIKRGDLFFCSRSCRTGHEISPGIKSGTTSLPSLLD